LTGRVHRMLRRHVDEGFYVVSSSVAPALGESGFDDVAAEGESVDDGQRRGGDR
jgi:hypothetical protein